MGTTTHKGRCKPIMKWAGGKTQMLPELISRVPAEYGRYIEPFFGGGALFFALEPKNAIIADSNPELINMYQQVAECVEDVIAELETYENTEEVFYETRAYDWTAMSKTRAAARTLYLNHTCFNGLYRVNRKGDFNVPFGHYKKVNICDAAALRKASKVLQGATIVCGDYLEVLGEYALPGDFVFLDPPYVPISKNAEFKRYTKEQFYEEDHRRLADMVAELARRDCSVVLTNSNHPLVTELYGNYDMTVVQTKRHISCHGDTRCGEDVIVTVSSSKKLPVRVDPQVEKYPPTRFMGSKQKLLPSIWEVVSQFNPESVLDLFSGSGIVSYLFKAQGMQVTSNDHMSMSSVFTRALIENNNVTLSEAKARALLQPSVKNDGFVSSTFADLYYTDAENRLIDDIRANIKALDDPYERSIAMMALIRACTKKRPRGIFTYTGYRYDDGRKDLQKTLSEQFLDAVWLVNSAVFDNGKCNISRNEDAMTLEVASPDLVYLDPPYYSKLSDNEYVRRYHFVEGLARDWEGVEIQQHTKTKKFKSYPTPFRTEQGAVEAFRTLFERYADSVIVVSYSSNSLPDRDTMVALLSESKRHVDVIPVDHTYSFGNQSSARTHRNVVKEFLFVGY